MAAQIKDLRELTQKCKGINSRGDARERVQAASRVIANVDARTISAAARVLIALGESKKLRDVVKDELYNMGREKHSTGFDEFKPTSVTEEDVEYCDKAGLETILDFFAAAAIVADSAVEARQDSDLEIKKLKEKVKEIEVDSNPMNKSLKDAKLHLRDIGKVNNDKYDPYSRDDRGRDDDRRTGRDRRDDDRYSRDRDRRDDRYNDRGRDSEAYSRRGNEDRRTNRDRRDDRYNDRDRRDDRYNDRDRRDDRYNDRDRRDDRYNDRDRRDRDYASRDRRDNYDSRRDDRGSENSGKDFASALVQGFQRAIYGNNR